MAMNAHKGFIKVILDAMWVKFQDLGGGPILMAKNKKNQPINLCYQVVIGW
jgi:hypothetical protein